MKRPVLPILLPALSFALAACQTAGAAPETASQAVAPKPAAPLPAAAEPPAIVAGVCADCHAVKAPWLSPNVEAPTFAALANREGLTRTTLTDWLLDAHNYPDLMEFALDEDEASKVADYVMSLKDPDFRPAQ